MVTGGRSIRWTAALLAGATLAGCGDDYGDDGTDGPGPATLSAAPAAPSGDAQAGTAGEALAQPLRIVVRRGDDPEAGAVVAWSAPGTGASMTPAVDTTGADGLSTSTWQLATEPGLQRAEAEVADAEGSPIPFTATAAAPDGGANEVQIRLLSSGGNRFEPSNVTVPVGTRITWTWVGGFHDLNSTGAATFPGSGEATLPPHSYSFTFDSPGTYLYFCSVHGDPDSGMRGTIVVQ
jgi:plastocyanin